MVTTTASAADAPDVERLSGPTRFSTAAAIAAEIREVQGQGPTTQTSALLVRADSFADALAASNLTCCQSSATPILLTGRDELPPATIEAIEEGNVVAVTIVGGSDVVSTAVADDLRARGVQVQRIQGADRYETTFATYLNKYSFESNLPYGYFEDRATAILATGRDFPDAIAAGPLVRESLPILLTDRDRIPDKVQWAFPGHPDPSRRCAHGICIKHVIILGGTSAISPAVEAELTRLGATYDRIAGPDRTATAAALAQFAADEFGWTLGHVELARGDKFPDAVAGGPLGATERSPILLAESPTSLGDATRTLLERHASAVSFMHVYGDATAVSEAVVEDARRAAT